MIGTKLAHYEITSHLGSGGMGEVYQATDRKLGRSVAIKLLPDACRHDNERVARFEREARVLASLNHPNIAAIYGLEESGGRYFLVMEFVPGETLAARIKRSKLSIQDTVRYGAQIADALAAAHAHGVVHRDLKPANIMITKSGVKVLDFGLAKTSQEEETLTGTHVVMGTPAYMAPEQKEGRECDARSDIYAFGLVLFEMATEKHFTPEEPPLRGIPDELAHVIERCLEREPDERWQSASDLKRELVWNAKRHAGPSSPEATSAGRWVWVALIGIVLLGAAAAYLRPAPANPELRVVRLSIPQSEETAVSINLYSHNLALTPDGSRVVYVSNAKLFVRPLDALEPTELATGRGLANPFVSPDGQWVGYTDGLFDLKKVAMTGGTPVALARLDAPNIRGATWLPDNTIIFATEDLATGLQSIHPGDNSGTAVLTRPNHEQGEDDHLWPEVLPGGAAVLFTITAQTGGKAAHQVALFDLHTRTTRKLGIDGSDAHYVRSGHLVYLAGGELRAIPFDLKSMETRGTAVTVLRQLLTEPGGMADFAVATNGSLVYVDKLADGSRARTLVWVDRKGKEESISAPPRTYQQVSISPDGTRLALNSYDEDSDIYIWDLRQPAPTLSRLTFDPDVDNSPIWMPDGRRVVYSSKAVDGALNLWWKAADGTGAPQRLTKSITYENPTGVSPDGHVVFHDAVGNIDIFQVSIDGEHEVKPLIQTKFTDSNGTVSPDGRWLAYVSDKSGQNNIYVCPYPDTTSSEGWQVSTSGGTYPLWSKDKDGKELFFLTAGGFLMRVGVEATGSIWKFSPPVKLLPFDPRLIRGGFGRPYDISPDGRKFVFVKVQDTSGNAPPKIIFVENWSEELKKLAPTK